MALSQDLLDQADVLAGTDAKRPKQVNLRRAISAAYYSLFHLLLDDIERCFAPGLRRTVQHAHMFDACEATKQEFTRQTHHPNDPKAKAKAPVPFRHIVVTRDLYNVASAFCDLQQARHEADYNMRVKFTRPAVRRDLHRCRRAHGAWERVRREDQARAFLTMMVVDFSKLKAR